VLAAELKFVKAFIFGSLNIKEVSAKVLKPVCPCPTADGNRQV